MSVSESQRHRVPIRTPSPRCSPITTSTTSYEIMEKISVTSVFPVCQSRLTKEKKIKPTDAKHSYLVAVVTEVLDPGLDAVGDLLAPLGDELALVGLAGEHVVEDGVDHLLDCACAELVLEGGPDLETGLGLLTGVLAGVGAHLGREDNGVGDWLDGGYDSWLYQAVVQNGIVRKL